MLMNATTDGAPCLMCGCKLSAEFHSLLTGSRFMYCLKETLISGSVLVAPDKLLYICNVLCKSKGKVTESPFCLRFLATWDK